MSLLIILTAQNDILLSRLIVNAIRFDPLLVLPVSGASSVELVETTSLKEIVVRFACAATRLFDATSLNSLSLLFRLEVTSRLLGTLFISDSAVGDSRTERLNSLGSVVTVHDAYRRFKIAD